MILLSTTWCCSATQYIVHHLFNFYQLQGILYNLLLPLNATHYSTFCQLLDVVLQLTILSSFSLTFTNYKVPCTTYYFLSTLLIITFPLFHQIIGVSHELLD
jgi:hypothetical protein